MSLAPAGCVRSLMTSDGTVWTVSELRVTMPRGDVMFLFFESATVIRRASTYPPDWYELPDEMLAGIGESA